jgi:PAS domain S-box-containing protein
MFWGGGGAETIAALRRSLTRWVVLALAADAALVVVDVLTGPSAKLTTAFFVPPLALALVEPAETVAGVAFVSAALALTSGAWDHYFLTGEHLYRLAIVLGSCLLAVIGARLRVRALTARDRMGLLAEIAQIADGRLAIDESLGRLAGLLVPAVADFCEIVAVEPAGPRRVAVSVAGCRPELEQALRAREVDERSLSLEPQVLEGAHASHVPGLPLRSAIRVPVRSAEVGTRAVLTLGIGSSRRHYGPEDLRFAQTAASRAGLVMDNLRLVDELRGARQRLEAIVGSLADAVTIRDRSGRLVYANQAAVESMGIASIDDIVERDPDALLRDYIVTDEEGRSLSSSALPSVRLLQGKPADPLLLRYVDRASGAEAWRLLKATPLYDPDGNIEAAITIIEDVTAAKRAERQTGFLARVSDILASSLDYGETLRNVAWLAVPDIADWCTVDLVDESGGRRQVVVAHSEDEKLSLAERLREYDGAELDPGAGLGAVLATGQPQLYADITDEMLELAAQDEEHLRLLRAVGMRSLLMVAMRTGGRTVGAMTLVNAESARRFTDDDVSFAEQVAARAAVAVENARLYTERSQIAATLQQSLLPEALPEIEGWEVASLYRPARSGQEVEVGGDFYDAFRTERGWMMLIGDVTGKGIEAAAMTSLVRHGARFVGEQLPDPSAVLARIDAALRKQASISLCSAVCLRIEGDRLCIASAGHPLPLVVTDDGVRSAGRAGPVLGAFPDSEWPLEELVLGPDEVLLLYTDGVTDTVGSHGRFGEQRLRRTTAECGPLPAEELLSCVDKALSDFQIGPQADDTAAVALRLAGEPAPRTAAMQRRAEP